MEKLEDLLALTASGDRVAFRRVYQLTAPKLYGIVRRMIRNQERSEELLQEAYLKVWREAGRYDPSKAPAMAWLVILTRRLVIDDLRRTVVPTTSIDDDEALANRLAAPDPEQDPIAQERLHFCIDRLREDYRKAILLAYFNGYTYEQLSAQLGRPVGTLKTWYTAA